MTQTHVNGNAQPGSPILLYHNKPEPGASPFVQRVRIVLAEKKLQYELSYVDLGNKPQEFVDLARQIWANPAHRGQVPILIDGHVKLAESDIISEYLDGKYSGNKLLPRNPYKLGLVRLFIVNYAETVLPKGYNIIFSETAQANEAAIPEFVHGLKVLDKFLATHGDKGGSFLLGNEFSYAEAATLPLLYRISLFLKEFRGIDVNKIIEENSLTHLKEWKQAGFERSSFKDTLPPDSLLIQRGKTRVKVALKDLK